MKITAAALLFLTVAASAQVTLTPAQIAPTSTITTVIRDSSGMERAAGAATVRFRRKNDRMLLNFQSSAITGNIFGTGLKLVDDSTNASILHLVANSSGAAYITADKAGSGSYLALKIKINNAIRSTFATDGGFWMEGATGSSQGAGTINAVGLYINGVALSASGSTAWTKATSTRIQPTTLTDTVRVDRFRLGVSQTAGLLLKTDASGNVSTAGVEVKGFTIENPTSSEDLGIPFTFPYAVTIDSVRAWVQGTSSPSVTIQLAHGTNLASPSDNLFSSGQAITSTTTGHRLSTFSDNTLAAAEILKLTTSAQSGTVTALVVAIFYRRT